jgi:hypothetical protein
MIYKIALKVIAVLVYFYICVQLFNIYCMPWIGIGGAILGGIFLLDQLIKLLKKQREKL